MLRDCVLSGLTVAWLFPNPRSCAGLAALLFFGSARQQSTKEARGD